MQMISFSEPMHIRPRVPAPATYLIVPDGKIVSPPSTPNTPNASSRAGSSARCKRCKNHRR